MPLHPINTLCNNSSLPHPLHLFPSLLPLLSLSLDFISSFSSSVSFSPCPFFSLICIAAFFLNPFLLQYKYQSSHPRKKLKNPLLQPPKPSFPESKTDLILLSCLFPYNFKRVFVFRAQNSHIIYICFNLQYFQISVFPLF